MDKELNLELEKFIEENYEPRIIRDSLCLGFVYGKTLEAQVEPEIKSRTLDEAVSHLGDNFSQRLFYLIDSRNMEDVQVYKDAYLNRKIFSKARNDKYHPSKLVAQKLCFGLKLNYDESKDLLARAGYGFSPSDLGDVILSFFLQRGEYDLLEVNEYYHSKTGKSLI